MFKTMRAQKKEVRVEQERKARLIRVVVNTKHFSISAPQKLRRNLPRSEILSTNVPWIMNPRSCLYFTHRWAFINTSSDCHERIRRIFEGPY